MNEPVFFHSDSSRFVVGEVVELAGDEGKHAASVRRMRVGESIALSDGHGTRASGVVAAVTANSLSVRVNNVVLDEKPAIQITLIQALAKGDRDELAIQAATELGAIGFIPWQAKRSISRWDSKAEKGRQRWHSIVTEAAKQSLRSWFPTVKPIVSTTELVKLVPTLGQVLVLDPTANSSLVELEIAASVALIVGPEGGIDQSELELLEQAGAVRVHLGNGILRTSTAGMAAISYLVATKGLWVRDA